jgi:hypothetical protein
MTHHREANHPEIETLWRGLWRRAEAARMAPRLAAPRLTAPRLAARLVRMVRMVRGSTLLTLRV